MALLAIIREGHKEYKSLFAKLFLQYSNSHRIAKDGKILPWIDEVLSPYEQKWTAREILKNEGFKEMRGGRERGKDYNHSTFCDLLICGLFGVTTSNDSLECDPIIPDSWDYARISNLHYRGKLYTLTYDKTGRRFGKGVGFYIEEQ